ncbi:MAG: hypothetical protein ACHBN1_30005 [Heteroscytonema crispum UTEX LB 1556]
MKLEITASASLGEKLPPVFNWERSIISSFLAIESIFVPPISIPTFITYLQLHEQQIRL